MDKNKNSDIYADLRKQAEDIIKLQPEKLREIPEENIQRLIHELQTHQIELDMQNDELRQIEQELSTLYDQYFELYDLAPVGYFTISEKGLIQKVNLTGAGLLDLDKDKVLNKQFNHFVFPEDQDKHYLLIRKAFQTKTLQSDEIRIVKNDSSVFYANLSCIAFSDVDGINQLRLTVTDITGRKQEDALRANEEKLRESEQRYRNIIAQAGGVAYQRDWQNGTYTFMDEGIKHLTGYSSDEMTPELFERLVDDENPDDIHREFIRSEISQQIGGNASTLYQGERRIKTKDGQIKFVSDSSIELRNANGEIVQTLGMIQDITQRKFSEQHIRESELKYRILFNGLADTIFIHDLEGHFLEVNDVAVEQLGYNREELLKTSLMDIDSPDFAELIPERMETIIDKGYAFFESEHITKDGRKIPIEVNAKIIEYNGMLAVIAISRDVTERKQAQDILKESEEQFRSVIEQMTDGFALTNDCGVVIEWNKAQEALTGLKKSDVVGQPIWEAMLKLIPENLKSQKHELSEQMQAEIKSILHKDSNWTSNMMEQQILRSDGSTIIVQDTTFIVQKGTFRYLGTILKDITERKQAESLLRENEEKYRALVEGLPDVIMRFDQNARHIYVSNSITKDTGALPEQLIGKTHHELGLPDVLSKYWEQVIARVFDTGQTYEDELEFDSINGPIIYNWRLVPEINESGNVVSVLGIARDITEYRKSEKSYQDIFNGMINGFALNEIICDESGNPIDYRFIDVNPAFEKLIGLSRDLVVGNTVLDVMPETESNWIDICGKVALTGETIYSEEYIKGLGKHFEVTVYSSQKGRFVTIFSDITDRKEAEALREKLQQTTKMESIGRLAGSVAHDFNNLLMVIQGSASLGLSDLSDLSDLSKNDPIYDRLKMIQETSDRAAGLTRQLLAFSRKQIIEMKVINLYNLINNLSNMLGRLIGEDVDLQIMLSKDIGNINADAGQIEQVIMNLSVNARDAMPKGGKLTIEIANIELDKAYCKTHVNTQPGKYVMVTVSDNGCGMDDATKKHIFEPFFTTKSLGEGTGLGLANVYGIVKQHNGSIEFYSELGYGTTFKIYLPIVEGEVLVQQLKESKETKILTGNETILVVEDEDIVRDMVVEFLSSLGYNVLSAENGGMALMITEQHKGKIHLMLTDVVMPNMNGHQLADGLQRDHPEIKVLYTSGYTENVIAHHGVLDTGVNFIGKPYRLQSLAQKLRGLLDV